MIFEWCFCTNRLLSFRILPRITKIGSLRSFYHIFLTEFLPGGSPAIQNGGRFSFLPGIVELPGSFISDTYRSQMSSQISLENIWGSKLTRLIDGARQGSPVEAIFERFDGCRLGGFDWNRRSARSETQKQKKNFGDEESCRLLYNEMGHVA